MDAGLRLERVLRHLKNDEPEMDHWQSFGNVRKSTEVDGVLLNAGFLNQDTRHMLDGLILAVLLLAKKCTALERELASIAAGGTEPNRGARELADNAAIKTH